MRARHAEKVLGALGPGEPPGGRTGGERAGVEWILYKALMSPSTGQQKGFRKRTPGAETVGVSEVMGVCE